MFEKILIANRGAIACRVIRTLKVMNIRAIAVYAQADADSRHVLEADEAHCLGDGNAAQTYLDQDKLFAIARTTGAQAIHPGYGFLSENAEFARRCARENIVFLGPTPEQMEAFGLKHTARQLATDNALPLLPGSGLVETLDEALNAAHAVGLPVMLKSTAGGGGIGMQLCHSEDELRDAYDSVRRLSANNFSNSGVFIEKYVTNARHIEVQIFGDGIGGAIALGERDCSSQRRNQKVIEETPAPNLPDNVRQQLQEVSVRLAKAVNYRSAGTIEFIYDAQQQQVYFLEVNTRLQVEHGVTEQIYGVDLVRWIIEVGAIEFPALESIAQQLKPRGHAIQVRVYAEDPGKQFQPSAGLLSAVQFPEADGRSLRIDHWIDAGLEVSPFFDPMLAKIIAWGDTREQAIAQLDNALAQTVVYGVETNIDYCRAVLRSEIFLRGDMHTRFLNSFTHHSPRIDVLRAGTMTTLQDFPGRSGYWDVGVPPSGPFDDWSFRLGNRLLNNAESVAGLEITLGGPTLQFRTATQIVLAGAELEATLDGVAISFWTVIDVAAGSVLSIGKCIDAGARAYLLVKNGIQCPTYLGAKSTFTLGQFGGHNGRALRVGDVLHIEPLAQKNALINLMPALRPAMQRDWNIAVMYGPHGAPDFFTADDIDKFFAAEWEVHYNSSRTGVRLIGPKPEWARSDGGEAGMHPSNIHDNAYALGAIDFTGDMPVILGPDGPSLGGFVCPATVIRAERWKIGQLKAGDRVRFIPVDIAQAVAIEQAQNSALISLQAPPATNELNSVRVDPIVGSLAASAHGVDVIYRCAGDKFLLVEYGEQKLDIALRFRVHALMLQLQKQKPMGVFELTPGIRSLQVHYDNLQTALPQLLEWLQTAEAQLGDIDALEVPARVVHIPLSWDDAACRLAIEKYMQSVRKDAPWCPSNIEFIRRINGLDSIDEVKRIVFDASYAVMGLGDVYLGAPVATPLDPRHRLVTTKYNPARTWTAENSVGIGGSYMCVYGMEGPGGYQFVGRTLQMWNRHRRTTEFTQPWLLRFFDQIRFYEVSAEELVQIRQDFPRGQYPLRIEETTFKLREYQRYLDTHAHEISEFTQVREAAFAQELQHWRDSGQFHFDSAPLDATDDAAAQALPAGCSAVESHVAGNIWKLLVQPGDSVHSGQTLAILESMKMEIELHATVDGSIESIQRSEGSQISAGQTLMIIREAQA
ncbi:MAG: urea carboxylase [Verrucomicrobiaceae bacterium]|nr:urea carboxylase [Verrucomicrobiaceae bacterium]